MLCLLSGEDTRDGEVGLEAKGTIGQTHSDVGIVDFYAFYLQLAS